MNTEEKREQFDYYFKQIVGQFFNKKIATSRDACRAYEQATNAKRKELKIFDKLSQQFGIPASRLGQYYNSTYILCFQRAPTEEDINTMHKITKAGLMKKSPSPRALQQEIFQRVW